MSALFTFIVKGFEFYNATKNESDSNLEKINFALNSSENPILLNYKIEKNSKIPGIFL